MKTLMVVLGLLLFTLCVAEDLQLDQQAGDTESIHSPSIESACHCESQNLNDYFLNALKELEAKQRNSEIELEDLRRELKGKSVQ